MPEIKKEHAVAGGIGLVGLIGILIQQMFAMDARSAENWRKHSREDMALHERVAKLEARADWNHGASTAEEAHEEEKAAAAEVARPELQALVKPKP